MVNNDDAGEQATAYVKGHAKEIITRFANPIEFSSSSSPMTIFMAGSPGAGKTEYSLTFAKAAGSLNPPWRFARIDADEIRNILPGYTGNNSAVVQKAASLGVHTLFNAVLRRGQDAIIDGTFASLPLALQNVRRSLKRGRRVGIVYVYQDPLVAWEFTKKRERLEGRNIPQEAFIKAFFAARENVNAIKQEFPEVHVGVVIKDVENKVADVYEDVELVDKYVDIAHDERLLMEKLK